jgi:CTP synthase (UTP-ammonia lyase)
MDADTIYRIPALLHEQGLDDIVLEKLGMDAPAANLAEWDKVYFDACAEWLFKQWRSATIHYQF